MTEPSSERSQKASVQQFLLTVPPLNRLSSHELDVLVAGARIEKRLKGETVFSEGQKVDGAWIIQSGRVEILKYSSSGRTTAIESLAPGKFCGTLCRIGGGHETYPCTAVAAVNSTLIRLPEAPFWAVFDRNPDMVAGMCALCSEKLKGMQEIAASAQEPADKRVVKTLLRLFETHGATFSFSKREISELAGTAPETTIRIMNSLERKRWIACSRGQVTLLQMEKLKAYLTTF